MSYGADPSTTGPWNRRGGGASPANEEYYPKITMFLCPSDPNDGDHASAPSSFAVNAGFFPDPVAAQTMQNSMLTRSLAAALAQLTPRSVINYRSRLAVFTVSTNR